MYCKKLTFLLHFCVTPFSFCEHSIATEDAILRLNEFYDNGGGVGLLQRRGESFLNTTNSIAIIIPAIVNLFDGIQQSKSSAEEGVQIILVHGTFAAHFDWYKPGGEFYDAICIAGKERFGDLCEITPFRWTGYLGCMARVEAATELAELILNSKKKVYTVGHSHGGNVINLASQILELVMEPTSKENRIKKITKIATCLLEKNEQESEKWENTRRSFPELCNLDELIKTLVLNIYSLGKEAVDILEQEDCEKKARTTFFPAYNLRAIAIEENYLLATPVAAEDLAPSTKIVNKSFSFYSKNDLVQPIFGLYGRKYGLPRNIVTDICTIFCHPAPDSDELVYDYPRHTDLHSATMGRALLFTPELCDAATEADYNSSLDQFDMVFYKDFTDFKKPTIGTPVSIENSVLETWLENLKDFASMFT
jgi:hypothetical protein